MKSVVTYIIIIWGVLLLPFRADAQQIVSEESYVTFELSNLKWNTVEGRLPGLNGTVAFNRENLSESSFEVRLSPETINTGNGMRDDHLQNEQFFDTDNHPRIAFTSDVITQSVTGYETTGTLTIKGNSKTVSIPFGVEEKGNKLVLSGYLEINRRDFDVGENTSSFVAGENVRVDVQCVIRLD